MVGTVLKPLPGKELTGEENGLDDLFNYDASSNDPFGDDYQPAFSQEKNKITNGRAESSGIDLGIDEKVEVARRPRAPRVKLDENLLLSPAGITKLRLKMKSLSFKGRGHEFNDISKLLSQYQLWLDDLFPKARFLDALSMVEKLGHRKQIYAMRMSLINETKTNLYSSQDKSLPTVLSNQKIDTEVSPREVESDINIHEKQIDEKLKRLDGNSQDLDNLYNATPEPVDLRKGESRSQPYLANTDHSPNSPNNLVTDLPEDELDALLAEEDGPRQPKNTIDNDFKNLEEIENINFDDDEDAMAEMDLLW